MNCLGPEPKAAVFLVIYLEFLLPQKVLKSTGRLCAILFEEHGKQLLEDTIQKYAKHSVPPRRIPPTLGHPPILPSPKNKIFLTSPHFENFALFWICIFLHFFKVINYNKPRGRGRSIWERGKFNRYFE